MTIKTVQIFDPATPLDLSPNFDRLSNPHEPTRRLHEDLINRGELPRYRGDETQITVTDDAITVVMEWKSLAVAQEYTDYVLAYVAETDPEKKIMRSIEIVEV